MAASSGQNGSRKTTTSSNRNGRNSSSASNSRSRNGSSNGRGRSTTSQSTKKRQNVQQPDNSIMDEIVLILTFAVLVFVFLCTVGIIGTPRGSEELNFGDYIQHFMLGLFGYTAYIVPVVAFFAMALGISNRNNYFVWFKIGSLIALVLVAGVLMHMICYGDLETFAEVKGWPKEFYNGQNGGGVIWGAVALGICALIGKAGTVFLLIVLTIIALVLLTGKSFIKGVKQGSKKLYETTKEEGGRLKEFTANVREDVKNAQFEDEYNEDEHLLRRHKRASGVTMDTSLSGSSKSVKKTSEKEESFENGKTEQPLIPLSDTEEVKALNETPVVKKESSDIHQIEYVDSGEEDDWIQPVSVRTMHEVNHDDDDIVKPIRRSTAEEIKPVEEAVNVMDEPLPVIKEEIQTTAKPVAHLRSRDKSAVGFSVDSVLKEAEKPKEKKVYKFPPINLLKRGEGAKGGNDAEDMAATAKRLEETLETFGVRVKVTDYSKGPAVTRYELHPEQGVKVSRILSLADDIKLNLAASDIRIEAPIPGKMAVGIEVPNKNSSAVHLRELLDTNEFNNFPSNLAFAVGKDIGGQLVVTDIAKMPHVLIAGATGSGKSVCINTLIMSILYKAHPDDVKMIMIDPKVVELNVYNGIPHLMIPVVTDPKKASAALAWGVAEMTERYKKFADAGVRDLKGYNQKAENGSTDETGLPMKKMPQIIIIVDELADLMMVASKEVEESICRLAQLARAAGIHLIIATQRPSVDVITGLIKANMPSRIAFSVSSGIDSRTILDANGAEKLLGKGDMLFFPQGYSKPARVQGAFVSDKEVADVVDFIKNQSISNDYGERIEEAILNSTSSGGSTIAGGGDDYDTYFAEAGRFVIEKEKGSIGMLQRVFKIGFNRAARIMDQLEEAGVVGPEEGTKPRRILMSMNKFEQFLQER